MMASKPAFGANAAEEEHQACQITALLDYLANASIQKNTTINILVASNAQLMNACEPFQEPWPCNHLIINFHLPTNECFEILPL
jgi:hypothetical protein